MKVGELFGELTLKSDQFDRQIDNKKSVMGSLGGVAKKAGLAVGAALGAGAVAGTMAFASFDKGMREVFTLLPDITGKEMGKMTGQVKGFATEFGVLPDKVVPALYQSISAGVPKENVFDFLETAQKAAKGGVTELSTAVDGISSVVNAYGSDVIDATKASDLMFTAVKGGITNFEEMSSALFNVTPIASALGVKFGDVTAAMATMTAQKIPTSVATTQLRQMMIELSKAGTATSETFEEVAGVGFKEFIAGGGNVQDALQLLEGHAKETGVGINDLFGSSEAGMAALALTGKQTRKFADELKAAKDSAGATDAAFKTMSGGLSDAFDKIKAAGMVILITIGELLAPAIQVVADAIITAMPIIQAAISDAFAVVGPILSGFGDTLRALTSGDFAGFVASITSIFGGSGQVSTQVKGMSDKVQPIIKQVGDFVSKIWDDIQKFTKKVWPDIQKIIASAIEMVRAIIEKTVEIISAVWERWGDNILRAVETVWNLVKTVIESALKVIKGVIQVVTGIMKGDWSQVWDGIKNILAGVWDAMIGIVKAAIGLVHNIITAAWDAVRAITRTVWERIKDAVSGAIESVKEAIRNELDRIRERWSGAWDLVRDKVVNAWDRIKAAVGNGMDRLLQWFKDLPDKIKNAIGNLGRLLWDVGKDIIGGLVGGIVEAAKNIGSAVGGAVSSAVKALNPFGGGVGAGNLGGGLVSLGQSLQAQGFRVGGHPNFGGVTQGAHAAGSYHYIGRAIDINWGAGGTSAEEMSVLTGLGMKLKAVYGTRLKELLGPWNDANHRDHLHVAMANGGWINEEIYGVGLRSGRTYSFGEHGRERITPEDQVGGITKIYNVDQVVLPNIRGAVQAEEFFGSISQVVRQGA